MRSKNLYELHSSPHVNDDQFKETRRIGHVARGMYLGTDKYILNTGVELEVNRYLEDHRLIHTYTHNTYVIT